MTAENTFAKLRRQLHRYPELSGEEFKTARRVADYLLEYEPSELIENLGGTGVAAVFDGLDDGPTVLLRCELDALPIFESADLPHRSTINGVSHKCGHDGHMAVLLSVAADLASNPPNRGRVVLLFQPAEENGMGADAVVRDPQFKKIQPNYAFAFHNLPGFDFGEVAIRNGTFCCASRGMVTKFQGKTAHAAQPETGISPAEAMNALLSQLSAIPKNVAAKDEIAFATVIGARLGEKAFGTTPCNAEVWATLRTETDDSMAQMSRFIESEISRLSAQHRLQFEISYEDIFQATVNTETALEILCKAVNGLHPIRQLDQPLRWSEDFGRITSNCEGALFGIGAGHDIPDLHNPEYDFPDELIPIASNVYLKLLDHCLNSSTIV